MLVKLLAKTTVLVLLASIAAAGVPTLIVEDFSTSTFMDPDSTTAVWDTAAGEVRLPDMTPAVVGTYNTAGRARVIDLRGDLAFVADGTAGLLILDVSDPTLPSAVGALALDDYAIDILVAGQVAYVADYGAGLQVVDVSDPTSPVLLTTYVTTGSCYELALAGDLLYMCCNGYGLTILDVSDPAVPVPVGGLGGFSASYGLAVEWPWVYFLGQGAGDATADLHVIDATDPAACADVGHTTTPSHASAVTLDGLLAYVVDGSGGLHVIDVSDPAAPVTIGSYSQAMSADDVVVHGDIAFIADFYAGLVLLDVTDPTSPALITSIDTSNFGQGYGCTFAGERIYLADGTAGVRVIEPWTWGAPVSVAMIIDDHDLYGDYFLDAWVRGDVAYVKRLHMTGGSFLGNTSHIEVVDISDPGDPVIVRSFTTPIDGWLHDLDWSAERAWLVEGDYLTALDLSDPLNPQHLVSHYLGLTGGGTAIVLAGPIAYLAVAEHGVEILDVSDPDAVTTLGSMDTAGEAQDIALDGDLAYVADGLGGLVVLDVSDPTTPVQLSVLSTGGEVTEVVVDGPYACCGGSDLLICDVSDPALPSILYQGNGSTRCVATEWPFVYASNDTLPLILGTRMASYYTLDATDPTAPTVVARNWVPGYLWDLEPDGDLIHVVHGGLFAMLGYPGFMSIDRRGLPGKVVADNVVQSLIYDLPSELQIGASAIRYTAVGEGTVVPLLVYPDGSPPRPLSQNVWHHNFELYSLGWRAELQQPLLGGPAPRFTDMRLEWRFPPAVIDSIVDVPADQGGWVRVHFSCSSMDLDNLSSVTAYNLYRRVDDPGLVAKLSGDLALGAYRPAVEPSGLCELETDGRVFHASPDKLNDFPPGFWEVVNTVMAIQQDHYIALAPTLADANTGAQPSVYLLTTHQSDPQYWYISPPDSAYSVDNIAPSAPEGFTVDYGTQNSLQWLPSGAADFRYFKIYRGDEPGFTPDPAAPLFATAATAWQDAGGDYDSHYLISTVDHAGNESGFAAPDGTTGFEPMPRTFALHPVTPNPFNPRAHIRFDLPAAARVDLRIFDASGRRVRALIAGEQFPVGRCAIDWDGRDDSGRNAPAGVYFARLTVGGMQAVQRMMLVK